MMIHNWTTRIYNSYPYHYGHKYLNLSPWKEFYVSNIA